MERIKEAVERARQQGLGSVTPKPQSSVAETPPPTAIPARVQYTQTRVVSLDQGHLADNRIMVDGDDHPAVAAYQLLRTQILHKLSEHGWNSLAVTSPGRGEGRTTTAVNLAINLAREVNHTVLLVDFDMRNPTVHRMLGFEPTAGLGDYLYNNTPLSDILVNPGIERLVVLPCRAPITRSSELLSSPRMVSLVDELKSRYPSRIVIFDMPALLVADDPLAFAPYVDTFLLVVEEGKTRKEDMIRAVELLGGNSIIGTVVNNANPGTVVSGRRRRQG